jgi:hypothetical protein
VSQTYAEVESIMEPPTRRLFLRLVENHLAHVDKGCTYHVAQSINGDVHLIASHGAVDPDGITVNRLEDLQSWGLIRSRSGGRDITFTIPATAIGFYRYLSGAMDGAVTAVAERSARESAVGSTFANAHPEASHHLNEANLLLSNNDTALTVVNEVGSHLRSALHLVASAVLGDPTIGPEQAVREIVSRTSGSDFHADPATAKLAALAEEVLREAQRLDHVRDDEHKERPFQGWEELRRAVTLTVVTCTELAYLKGRL